MIIFQLLYLVFCILCSALCTTVHHQAPYGTVDNHLNLFVFAARLIHLGVCPGSGEQIDLPPGGFAYQILAIFMTLLEGNAFATFVSGLAPDPLTVREKMIAKIQAGR